jgi:hypothetical protein
MARAREKPRMCYRCGQNKAGWKSQYCASCKEARKLERRAENTIKAREYRLRPGVSERQRLKLAEYRKKHPERVREISRRCYSKTRTLRLYGMSRAEVEALSAKQDHRCAICGWQGKLHVDHHHAKNMLRGLLCGKCNRGIGMFGDSTELLRSAIEYLKKFEVANVKVGA